MVAQAPVQPMLGLEQMRHKALEARALLAGPCPAHQQVGGEGGTRGETSGRNRLVAVERQANIEEARMQLPILGMEQEVVEAILENDVVVLSGETGCGKTTQVIALPGYSC